MTGQLHLLRRLPPFLNCEKATLETFLSQCRLWRSRGGIHYGSWARHKPRRVDELHGGSVYFVHHGHILFRMPFVGVEPVQEFTTRYDPYFENHFAIVCMPETIHVEPHPVRFLRGWRYLEDPMAPADLTVPDTDNSALPDALRHELRELGL